MLFVDIFVRLVVSGDQTEILRAGYWPSYNVPFYEEVSIMLYFPSVHI